MVSAMMATIKITDRGSGVILRPMNSSSDCPFTYRPSTEISGTIINGEEFLSENVFRYLLFCLLSVGITIALWLNGKERRGGICVLSPLIIETVAKPITRALYFRPSFIGQYPGQGNRSVICMSSPHHHSFE